MLKNISIRTRLLALLGMMVALLLLVSATGIIAINKSYDALVVLNRIQGVELGNLASSNTNMQRVRVAASFAIRALETQQWDDAMAAAGRSGQYAIAVKEDLDRFLRQPRVPDREKYWLRILLKPIKIITKIASCRCSMR